MVKVLVDGAVAALQAHTDSETLEPVSERLAAALGERPDAIARLLVDQSRALLGARQRLVHLRGEGVIFTPSDELVVAGEVLIDPAAGDDWTAEISVDVVTARGPSRPGAVLAR